jgi:uncharacterized protein with ATP-grasp and redox domains
MRSDIMCFSCALRQALRTLQVGIGAPDIVARALADAASRLSACSCSLSPAELSSIAIKAVRPYIGVEDPFVQAKIDHTFTALSLYPRLRDMVEKSLDPLETALKLAACGNVIDLGTQERFDIDDLIARIETITFSFEERSTLEKSLCTAQTLLYIADNAGEIVFDRLALEVLEVPKFVVAVKSGPILNDAVLEDALRSGIQEHSRIITTGSSDLGVITDHCSEEFLHWFERADVVIAKGHANFETLDESDREIFFLLMVKCPVVGRRLDAHVGDLILTRKR